LEVKQLWAPNVNESVLPIEETIVRHIVHVQSRRRKGRERAEGREMAHWCRLWATGPRRWSKPTDGWMDGDEKDVCVGYGDPCGG